MTPEEQYISQFSYFKCKLEETDLDHIKNEVEYYADPTKVDLFDEDWTLDFKMNNSAVDDFIYFYHEFKKLINFNNLGFFIHEDGIISIQKTTDDSFFYMEFKGNRKVFYNFKSKEVNVIKNIMLMGDEEGYATLDEFRTDLHAADFVKIISF